MVAEPKQEPEDLITVQIPRELVWVVAKVLEWRERRGYGRLIVSFQNGKAGHIEDARVEKAPT